MEEGARLARDLHDGVLQTLTGTVLELEVLRRQLPETSPIRERLLDIQMLVVAQQRELRALIEPLKDTALAPRVDPAMLAARCRELGRRIERQWAQRVEVSTARWEAAVSERTARQIDHLVNEALVTAARHAGFPFHGQYDLKALDAMGLGPVTLCHRLRSLGGNLVIDSTPCGSQVDMLLPIVEERDGH